MSVAFEPTQRNDFAASPVRQRRRFTLSEYEKMISCGILTKQHRVELIRGEILEKIWVSGSRFRPHHQFSLEDFERMIEVGILTEQDRCELIRGEIIEKMTIGESHAACVKRLNRLFSSRLGNQVILGIQDPVVVAESRPEPDVTLLIPQDDFYANSTPRSADILLLIEVADSSLGYDRTEKLSLYAKAGVCEYWIANLNDECVEVYRDPQPNGTYGNECVLKLGETLSIQRLPGVSIAVDDVF